MFELLFLLVFTAVLVFTGISVIGILVAVAAGFALMMVAGMLGLVIKLLPWIIVIAIGVYFYREHKEKQARRDNDYRRRY
ncbi:Phage shock protein G [Photobacterium damselae subsp. piscicida]|uniref:Envelope stress response protein PspG n=1 Tax=Photobacterium damsela subsp. piscicida TaxID=38294 RepID=A0A1V1V8H8_PHODP|nr:envelope stress response protein PspG [Photobacterium damselae]MBE8130261.1 envelope stress response protein PspG [Photobacterium damselae subsp. piscicida]MDP2516779.1 envelope stress response protein PspG [Photobacterium damselae subsp. piscicida]MDP2531981.1 envelope stress response protein PspG [Photobacterium damselae subsp. piscicida]MDP2545584.1 envelope stress response protein PspG [Photobacterium damselae subsp. piscicida]MDP2558403.1 envelope stress response protein PspG [Photobac